MPSIAITGGIACGKSSTTQLLLQAFQQKQKTTQGKLEVQSYNADAEVAKLLYKDQEIIESIKEHWKELLGPTSLEKKEHHEIGISHQRIRKIIHAHPEERFFLEDLLHPRLQMTWKPLAKKATVEKEFFFLAEIPLLFEKHLSLFFDSVIVVGASFEVQINRLVTEKEWSREEAITFLSWQAPLETKISLADYLIWNDGSQETLIEQVEELAHHLIEQSRKT